MLTRGPASEAENDPVKPCSFPGLLGASSTPDGADEAHSRELVRDDWLDVGGGFMNAHLLGAVPQASVHSP